MNFAPMLILIILTLVGFILAYSIGFIRGVRKASDKSMKAYIKLKKQQGMNWDDISKEVMEIFKIRKENKL